MLSPIKSLLTCVGAAMALGVTTTTAKAPAFTYEFDPSTAGGVQGTIQVEYAAPHSSKATVSANLDFSGIDFAQYQEHDSNCVDEVTEYTWHIHVRWGSNNTSDSFAMCSRAKTDNHYDPLFACGPASEHVDKPECQGKVEGYKCTPERYAENPLVCEKGDLSGKFGRMKLDKNKRVSASWVDDHYPLASESTPQWNMLLHAVCGKATPRIACALAKESAHPVTPEPTKPQC